MVAVMCVFGFAHAILLDVQPRNHLLLFVCLKMKRLYSISFLVGQEDKGKLPFELSLKSHNSFANCISYAYNTYKLFSFENALAIEKNGELD